MLEWIANEAPELSRDPSVEELIRARWLDEVHREELAAQRHRSEASFGPLNRWPRYATIQESLVVDGSALASELADVPAERRWAERESTDASKGLYGSIDLVVVHEDGTALVIDHKAGAVDEEDVASDGRYRVQLLLYAAMVRDLGVRPTRAQVRPLGRLPFEVSVSDSTIDEAVSLAWSDVAEYNLAVEAGSVVEIARPSEKACQWCEFLLDCPAVWSGRPVDLGGVNNLEGIVLHLQNQQSGRIALKLKVAGEDESVIVNGLNAERVPALAELKVGDSVRIVGLSRTSGGYRAGRGRLDVALSDRLGSTDSSSFGWNPTEPEREGGE